MPISFDNIPAQWRMPLFWAEVDPMEYASLAAFRRDPEKVWTFYSLRMQMLVDAEPNAAHTALAALERTGLVAAVVTQNIDLLHERGGSRDHDHPSNDKLASPSADRYVNF